MAEQWANRIVLERNPRQADHPRIGRVLEWVAPGRWHVEWLGHYDMNQKRVRLFNSYRTVMAGPALILATPEQQQMATIQARFTVTKTPTEWQIQCRQCKVRWAVNIERLGWIMQRHRCSPVGVNHNSGPKKRYADP